ncbi:MAG TPA: L-2-hydroxyglutarate oxidase [Candidatus Acidoferrales bacterium]|nr:L-2-hydroxyglutarate oxidase [Candidatus Acidoferrales bacterium]
MEQFDIAIVGAGIVGLATAMLAGERYPDLKIAVLEKEDQIARHQSSHNSGVIHSGIYYRPGSAKAKNCVAGRERLIRFLDENDIPYEICGKVVVATSEDELPRLEELRRRGTANGVPGLKMLERQALKEIEPFAAGLRALLVPGTGIVDFGQVAAAYAQKFVQSGGRIITGAKLVRAERRRDSLVLTTSASEYCCRYMINCAGLFSDRVARMVADDAPAHESEPQARIVPFRGEYYMIVPERRYLVKNLIYPVPDPRFPFLGVHFTRTIHGAVEAGPNAVLALAREGYRRRDMNWNDIREMIGYPGFWRMAAKYWKTGAAEMYRSLRKSAFVRALQRLIPEIRPGDLMPGGSGVRAQALSRAGSLLDDFVIRKTARAIHVINAPSPAATSSLAIGAWIVDSAAQAFDLHRRGRSGVAADPP